MTPLQKILEILYESEEDVKKRTFEICIIHSANNNPELLKDKNIKQIMDKHKIDEHKTIEFLLLSYSKFKRQTKEKMMEFLTTPVKCPKPKRKTTKKRKLILPHKGVGNKKIKNTLLI
jgi:hypothetical protein